MEYLPKGDEELAEEPLPPAEKPITLVPTKTQQSYGAILSVIIIMLMILVGAFYAWGERIQETTNLQNAANAAGTGQ